MQPIRPVNALKSAAFHFKRTASVNIGARRLSSRNIHLTFPTPSPRLSLQLPHWPPRRELCVTRLSFYSTQHKTSFSDPSRTGLFYHLVDPPTPLSETESAFALSFLDTPPARPNSSTVIGWLPATSTNSNSGDQGVGLNDFRENPSFRDLLHEAIKSGLENQVDDIQTNGAVQLQEGWMHIHDDRNIPPLGRIGDPDDIIATVLVKDSKIIAETYQPMPSYRMCTSDGPITLTPGLAQHLQTILVKRAELERSSM